MWLLTEARDRPFYLLTAQLGEPITLPPARAAISVSRETMYASSLDHSHSICFTCNFFLHVNLFSDFNSVPSSKKRLWIKTPYKDAFVVSNCCGKPVSVTINPLIDEGKEQAYFSITLGARVLKLMPQEVSFRHFDTLRKVRQGK